MVASLAACASSISLIAIAGMCPGTMTSGSWLLIDRLLPVGSTRGPLSYTRQAGSDFAVSLWESGCLAEASLNKAKQGEPMASKSARDIMTDSPAVCTPQTSSQDAARMMQD